MSTLRTEAVSPRVIFSGGSDPYASGTVFNVDTWAQAQAVIDSEPLDTTIQILFSRGGSDQGFLVLNGRTGGTKIGYQGARLPVNTNISPVKAAATYGLKRLIGPGLPTYGYAIKRSETHNQPAANVHLDGLFITSPDGVDSNSALVSFACGSYPDVRQPHEQSRNILLTQNCFAATRGPGGPIVSGPSGYKIRSALELQVNGCESRYGWYESGRNPYGGFDADCCGVAHSNGTGKIHHYHDFMTAGDELFAAGGNNPRLMYIIGDSLFDSCYFYRPFTWYGVYYSKNGIEWKQTRRGKVVNCIVDTCWVDQQPAAGGTMSYSVNQGHSNSNGDAGRLMDMSDFEFRDTWFRNFPIMASFADKYYANAPSIQQRRVRFYNIVATGIGHSSLKDPSTGGMGITGMLTLYNQDAQGTEILGRTSDVLCQRVLCLTNQYAANAHWIQTIGGSFRYDRTRIKDSIGGSIDPNGYTVSGSSTDATEWAAINAAGGSEFDHNVILTQRSSNLVNPLTNHYVNSAAALTLVDYTKALANNTTLADFDALKLAGDSPYRGAASDGGDIGPDIDYLKAHLPDFSAYFADFPT